VQYFDVVSILCRSAEKRVVAPQQRERGTHQRARRKLHAACLIG
jgi:hypothetical protein